MQLWNNQEYLRCFLLFEECSHEEILAAKIAVQKAVCRANCDKSIVDEPEYFGLFYHLWLNDNAGEQATKEQHREYAAYAYSLCEKKDYETHLGQKTDYKNLLGFILDLLLYASDDYQQEAEKQKADYLLALHSGAVVGRKDLASTSDLLSG